MPRCRYLRPASRGESGSVPHPDPEVRCWYLGRSQCRKCGVAGTSGPLPPDIAALPIWAAAGVPAAPHFPTWAAAPCSVCGGVATGVICCCCLVSRRELPAGTATAATAGSFSWRRGVKAHLVALLYSFSIFSSRLQEGRPQGRSHIARGGAVNAGPTKSTDCSSDSGYVELETMATSSSSSRAKPKRKQDRGWNVRDDLGGRSIPSSIPADR